MKHCYLLKNLYILRLLNECRLRNKNVYPILSEEPGVTGFMNIEITGHMCEIQRRDFLSPHRTNCDLVTDCQFCQLT
jgi:hypothetical protein